MGKKKGEGIKFTRYFKAPFRFLTKARELYVRTMSDWAARLEKCAGTTGCYAVAQFSIHPDGLSYLPSRNCIQNEELTELLKAASGTNQSGRVDDQSKILRQPVCVKSPAAGRCGARRTGRVGIEEDM